MKTISIAILAALIFVAGCDQPSQEGSESEGAARQEQQWPQDLQFEDISSLPRSRPVGENAFHFIRANKLSQRHGAVVFSISDNQTIVDLSTGKVPFFAADLQLPDSASIRSLDHMPLGYPDRTIRLKVIEGHKDPSVSDQYANAAQIPFLIEHGGTVREQHTRMHTDLEDTEYTREFIWVVDFSGDQESPAGGAASKAKVIDLYREAIERSETNRATATTVSGSGVVDRSIEGRIPLVACGTWIGRPYTYNIDCRDRGMLAFGATYPDTLIVYLYSYSE